MKTFLLLASCATALAAVPAHAVVVTLNYDLTGSNFIQSFGPTPPLPAPVDPLRLDFTLTFDNSVDTADGITRGLTVNSFNLPYMLKYTYVASGDFLIIGTDLIPSGACTTFSISTENFCAFIDNASALNASVTFDDFSGAYILSIGTPQRQFDAQTSSLVVTAAAIPEPASWAMMIGGFGMVGLATRRRSRVGTTVRLA